MHKVRNTNWHSYILRSGLLRFFFFFCGLLRGVSSQDVEDDVRLDWAGICCGRGQVESESV